MSSNNSSFDENDISDSLFDSKIKRRGIVPNKNAPQKKSKQSSKSNKDSSKIDLIHEEDDEIDKPILFS